MGSCYLKHAVSGFSIIKKTPRIKFHAKFVFFTLEIMGWFKGNMCFALQLVCILIMIMALWEPLSCSPWWDNSQFMLWTYISIASLELMHIVPTIVGCFQLLPSSSMNGIFRLSVCLSVCLSVFQELLPMTQASSMQKVKVRGHRSRSQRWKHNLTISRL